MTPHMHCACTPPFQLFPFPSNKEDPEGRRMWEKAVWRKDKITGQNWMASTDSRVCSYHFVDAKPTADHPYPTEDLGVRPQYASATKGRKPPTKRPFVEVSTSTSTIDNDSSPEPACSVTVSGEHSYAYEPNKCTKRDCIDQCNLVKELVEKYDELKETGNSGQDITSEAFTTVKSDKTLEYLDTDAKVKKFTGLRSQQAFEDLLSLVEKKPLECAIGQAVRNRSQLQEIL